MLCFGNHPFEDSAKLRIINANYTIPSTDRKFVALHNLISTFSLLLITEDHISFRVHSLWLSCLIFVINCQLFVVVIVNFSISFCSLLHVFYCRANFRLSKWSAIPICNVQSRNNNWMIYISICLIFEFITTCTCTIWHVIVALILINRGQICVVLHNMSGPTWLGFSKCFGSVQFL